MVNTRAIADQRTMEEFFRRHLELFPEATELVSLVINPHDENLVFDDTAVIVEYKLKLKKTDGSIFNLVLRGSADAANKRLKHYQVITALRQLGFDQGPHQVAKPVGYFPEFHLLLYENVAGQSLYDKFQWADEQEWKQRIGEAIDWLVKFHSSKIKQLKEVKIDEKEETKRFQRLVADLVKKYPSHQKAIERVAQKIKRDEQQLLDRSLFRLVHGDFQPDNIIFTDFPPTTVVIDFNDAMLYDELYDLATFTTQVQIMLQKLHKGSKTANEQLISQLANRYFRLRGLTLDKNVEQKLKLFQTKTLLHIKAVSDHDIAKQILYEIENY